jgi:hypothetical protein
MWEVLKNTRNTPNPETVFLKLINVNFLQQFLPNNIPFHTL